MQYRPTLYRDVVGQDHIVTILKNSIKKNRVSKAYLFVGPHGSGKTTLMRIFSRSIQCESPVDGVPCDKCESCINHLNGKSVNFMELDSASYGSIDDARHFKELSKYKSHGTSKPRILILDESHLLSNQSQNAFLKLLESKNNNLIIIFATTEYNKIIPQLASRCMELFIKIPNKSNVVDRLSTILKLENISFNIDALEIIADNTKCHIRNAINTVEQVMLYDENITTELVSKFLNLDIYCDYYHILINIKDDVNKSIDIFDNCSRKESVKNIHSGIFSVLVKSYQKFLGYNVKYSFNSEKSLISILVDAYKADLIKVLEVFNNNICLSKDDFLFCLFKMKNKIQYKLDLEGSVEIDQDVLSQYKEKSWFKNKQGEMWLKSNNRLKHSDNNSPGAYQVNTSVTEDIIPMEPSEFLDYIENMVNAG